MNKKGFTLMELLIVVVIITVFAAVSYPSYRTSVERARANEAVNMLGSIQTAQQKHFVNYETYGEKFQDINDFEPAIKKAAEGEQGGFNPNSTAFTTEYFTYTLNDNDKCVEAQRTDASGNNLNKGYSFKAYYLENRIRCYYTNEEGNKICSSLTTEESEQDNSINNTFYPIY